MIGLTMPDGSMYAGGGIGLGPTTSRYSARPATTPYPAPEVSSQPITVDAVAKKAVKDLARYAIGRGWTVRITYARGAYPHASTGRPGPVKDSLAIRMGKASGDRAVAVYVGGTTWTWDTLYRWKTGDHAFHRKLATVTELRATL